MNRQAERDKDKYGKLVIVSRSKIVRDDNKEKLLKQG